MSVGDLLVGSRLHHVGLVVADLDSAITNYQALGFGAEDRFDVPEQGIQAAFFPLAQGAVELIQPTDPEGAIGRFMAKRGEGFHHVAYAVDALEPHIEGKDLYVGPFEVGEPPFARVVFTREDGLFIEYMEFKPGRHWFND